MRLSTKGRYAVMAMADLARREGGAARAVALADIAARQEISLSYLEQLFARLRRKGLVKSARGPGGGIGWRGPRTTPRSPRSSTRWTSRCGPPAAAPATAA